jgi:alpha-beta hydrolase superfamily lysophospholipase
MSRPDFNLTNLEQRASNPDGTEGEGLSHKSGGIGGAGMVLVQVLELAPPSALLVGGEPQGAAIVVHDLGDHGGRYDELARALSEAGLIVSLPDLRGHGKSEGPRGHIPGLPEPVRDIHNVREHVAYRMPGAKSVVVGIGAGALFAIAYAKAHRDEVSALVLAAPLRDPKFGEPKKGGLLGMFKKPGPLSECPIGWTAEQMCADSTAQATWTADDRRGDMVTLRGTEVLAAAAREAAAGFAALDLPTLVLAGSDDPIAPAAAVEAFAAELGAECRTFEGRRHDLFRDAGHEEVIAAATEWSRTQILG